jgi:putative transposase
MREPFHQLYVHLVWATWDRLPLIAPEHELRLYSCLVAQVEKMKCRVVAYGGVEEHVHFVVRVRPTTTLAELIKNMKGASSHLMNHQIAPPDPKHLSFKWQGAYGAFSISPRAVETAKHYVLHQKEHHARGRLHDDWERCFIEETEDELDWPEEGRATEVAAT